MSQSSDDRSQKSARLVQLTVTVVFIALFSAACSGGNVWTLEMGDCFDDWEGATSNSVSEEITDVPIIDCSEPHDNEIYMMEELPDGDYSGDAAMEEMAIGVCYDGFEEFVGTAYENSDLDFGWLSPTSDSWAEGDREVICFVYEYDFDKLTGSMANAGV